MEFKRDSVVALYFAGKPQMVRALQCIEAKQPTPTQNFV